MRWPVIIGRVGLRTAAAMWRQRFILLVMGFGVAALSFYALTFARPTNANADCADTAMFAVTHVDEDSARAVYACLGASMRTTSEDQFVAGMRAHNGPGGQFDRVADQRTQDGGRIVFYTVHASGAPVVGYIVYLDAQGKIEKVE